MMMGAIKDVAGRAAARWWRCGGMAAWCRRGFEALDGGLAAS